MYQFTIESPKIHQYTKRSYMKIQDLFAKIGFYSAITILVRILLTDYLRFKFHQNIEELVLSKTKAEKPSQVNKDLNLKPMELKFRKEEKSESKVSKENESIKRIFNNRIKQNNFIKDEKRQDNKICLSQIGYFSFLKDRLIFCIRKITHFALTESLFSYYTYISISSKFLTTNIDSSLNDITRENA